MPFKIAASTRSVTIDHAKDSQRIASFHSSKGWVPVENFTIDGLFASQIESLKSRSAEEVH